MHLKPVSVVTNTLLKVTDPETGYKFINQYCMLEEIGRGTFGKVWFSGAMGDLEVVICGLLAPFSLLRGVACEAERHQGIQFRHATLCPSWRRFAAFAVLYCTQESCAASTMLAYSSLHTNALPRIRLAAAGETVPR